MDILISLGKVFLAPLWWSLRVDLGAGRSSSSQPYEEQERASNTGFLRAHSHVMLLANLPDADGSMGICRPHV